MLQLLPSRKKVFLKDQPQKIKHLQCDCVPSVYYTEVSSYLYPDLNEHIVADRWQSKQSHLIVICSYAFEK